MRIRALSVFEGVVYHCYAVDTSHPCRPTLEVDAVTREGDLDTGPLRSWESGGTGLDRVLTASAKRSKDAGSSRSGGYGSDRGRPSAPCDRGREPDMCCRQGH